MEYFTLNNQTQIPVIGEGTFLFTPDEAEQAVLEALNGEYELIDTANYYMNEKAVGRAMKASKRSRDEIYLSTKLWPTEYDNAKQAIDDTLERLGVDYIDLLFLHQPIGNYIAAYQAMQEAVKEGKVRSLGLSNFTKEKIEELILQTDIVPAVLQTESHPYATQKELRAFLDEHDIKIMAWYPLGHGDSSLVNQEIFTKLAQKYHKSNVQIILRWHTQIGNIVIPGSKSATHIKENADIFDFKLTDEEMAEIAKLDVEKRYYTATPEKLNNYMNMKLDYNEQK